MCKVCLAASKIIFHAELALKNFFFLCPNEVVDCSTLHQTRFSQISTRQFPQSVLRLGPKICKEWTELLQGYLISVREASIPISTPALQGEWIYLLFAIKKRIVNCVKEKRIVTIKQILMEKITCLQIYGIYIYFFFQKISFSSYFSLLIVCIPVHL